ncbi:3-phosphoshikimate 1-carboxyvinyltransferase [Nitrococcus mobilis Nb-231]|uniref:3-phosphoshikimate 1-carboxyvinyltransferase n=2 Tax=Nitrococcus mobilis TaxID=35797 RepID=A4BM53_9GAMM|nr:3-phosphoshikimate 1-carboxyvinyltransferase [Nitrococcus mobilis Nb-231]
MLAALAEGTTEIHGLLEGEDVLATLAAFRALGIVTNGPERGRLVIEGRGLQGLQASPEPFYLGNSGTAMRLLCGLLAGQRFDSILTGDVSLSQRPMRRVTEPLLRMGARVAAGATGTAPLHIKGGQALHGIHYEMPMASAQVKSCLLLAGLYAKGETCVIESVPSRDHTERMLTAFGYEVDCRAGRVCLHGGGRLHAMPLLAIPADISSAAFFLVGASIAPGSDLCLMEVGLNPTRTGVIAILKRMGADIEVLDKRWMGGEPVADLRVRHAALHGIHITPEMVPAAIDEFPALFVAAACAEGETLLQGAEELRVKESDRIAAMAAGLQALGITAEPQVDGIRIIGGVPQGGRLHARGDHRIAMAFTMMALRADAEIIIDDCRNVATSFPGFVELAASVGLGIRADVVDARR